MVTRLDFKSVVDVLNRLFFTCFNTNNLKKETNVIIKNTPSSFQMF